jgi:hypothetical protein
MFRVRGFVAARRVRNQQRQQQGDKDLCMRPHGQMVTQGMEVSLAKHCAHPPRVSLAATALIAAQCDHEIAGL